mmetsp:Transcript_1338/g.3306  ORF Transcript_1338/g.3306 Transcript_1338/m.3306 type:complete len:221 (-) Transcript_1338:164-826(-)
MLCGPAICPPTYSVLDGLCKRGQAATTQPIFITCHVLCRCPSLPRCLRHLLLRPAHLGESLVRLVQELREGNLQLLSVVGLLLVAENFPDLVVELAAAVAHEDDLQCLLDTDLSSLLLVVHQELGQVEQVSGLHSRRVRDATLVHGQELVPPDHVVQVVVDLPDPELDLLSGRLVPELHQRVGDLLPTELFVLLGVQPLEDALQRVELDRLHVLLGGQVV